MDRRGFLKFAVAAPVAAAIPFELPATPPPEFEPAAPRSTEQLEAALLDYFGVATPFVPLYTSGPDVLLSPDVSYKEYERVAVRIS